MGMFASEGTWTIGSVADPRWSAQGRTTWAVTGGMCPEAQAHIEMCEAKYGERPRDLGYSFFKD